MAFAASSFVSAFTAGTAVVGRRSRSFKPWLAPLANWIERCNQPASQGERSAGRFEPTPATSPDITELRRPTRLPLRVLRVVDGTPRQCAGRMVISGRMADVCAELDRLAAWDTPVGNERRPATN
jgi:hypothetical protein